jgi:hypothetical protein
LRLGESLQLKFELSASAALLYQLTEELLLSFVSIFHRNSFLDGFNWKYGELFKVDVCGN